MQIKDTAKNTCKLNLIHSNLQMIDTSKPYPFPHIPLVGGELLFLLFVRVLLSVLKVLEFGKVAVYGHFSFVMFCLHIIQFFLQVFNLEYLQPSFKGVEGNLNVSVDIVSMLCQIYIVEYASMGNHFKNMKQYMCIP